MQLFKQHQVFDRVVLPGASHLLLAAAAHLRRSENAAALELTDTIFEPLGVVELLFRMKNSEGSLEIGQVSCDLHSRMVGCGMMWSGKESLKPC